MNDLIDSFSSWESAWALLSSPEFRYQVLVLAGAMLLAWLLGRWIQRRLMPVIQPGVVAEGPRTAMRTGVLAVVPLILWLLLLGAKAVMRRHGMETNVLRPAMLLVGALALIRMGVFVLRHSLSPGSGLKAWEGVFTVSIWFLVALHVLGWLPPIAQALDEYAISFGQARISLYTLVSFVFFAALWLIIALWVSNAIQWRVMRSPALQESLKIAVSKLTKFVLLTVAVIGSMLAAGIDLTTFAVFGGALGVGLGLGLQRVISNFVSGIILGFEGSIRPGDFITLGNTLGTVKAMYTRHVVVRTIDGLDILVPNENLLTSEITNWTYDNDRRVRIRLPVQISYQDDPQQALDALMKVAWNHPSVLPSPKPDALLKNFGDSGIDLELRAWVEDPSKELAVVRSELNLGIWRELKAAGITIPFPQRDVHIIGAAPEPSPKDATPDSH
jgi:small-conductance mechanosensitive channel